MDRTPPPYEHLLSFATDMGFKRAFADENDTRFARRAIQVLASLDEPIERLTYHRNEHEPLTLEGRWGLIDVLCSDEKRNIFILEMQTGHLQVLLKRLFFYVLQEYHRMVGKGSTGFDDIKPIYCICILNGRLLDSQRLYHQIQMKNQDHQTVFEWVSFFIVELGKFDKPKEACASDLDNLLFTMKNGHRIDLNDPQDVPNFWEEEWLETVVEKLKSANLTEEERYFYEREWIKAASARASDKEWERKVEEARTKTLEERKKAVLAMLEFGIEPEKIAQSLGIPTDVVQKINAERQQ